MKFGDLEIGDIPIYIITVVHHDITLERARTVGYEHSLLSAITHILTNHNDIAEGGYYTHAVVERVAPGVHVMPTLERWYEYDVEGGVFNYVEESPIPHDVSPIHPFPAH